MNWPFMFWLPPGLGRLKECLKAYLHLWWWPLLSGTCPEVYFGPLELCHRKDRVCNFYCHFECWGTKTKTSWNYPWPFSSHFFIHSLLYCSVLAWLCAKPGGFSCFEKLYRKLFCMHIYSIWAFHKAQQNDRCHCSPSASGVLQCGSYG